MKKRTLISFIMALLMVLVLGCMPVQAASATKVKLNKTSVSLYKNQTYRLKAKVTGKKKKVKWKSSKPSVVSVSKSGKLKAKKKGTAIITVTVNKVKKTCRVKVSNPSIKLNKKSATLYYNKSPKTLKLTARVKGPSKKVKWSSSKKSVATVSKSGKVTGKKSGTAVIKASANGVSYSCKVTVKKKKTTLKTSAKNMLSLYEKRKYSDAQRMAKKLPKKANESCIRRMSTKMKQRYSRVLSSYFKPNRLECQGYFLTDINKDKVPEMVVKFGSCEADMQIDVWTYKNNEEIYCGMLGAGHSGYYAYPDGNGMIQQYGQMGYEQLYKVYMSGTRVKVKKIGRERSGGNYFELPYRLDDHYRWDSYGSYIDWTPLDWL